jgi:hypothetical protein
MSCNKNKWLYAEHCGLDFYFTHLEILNFHVILCRYCNNDVHIIVIT